MSYSYGTGKYHDELLSNIAAGIGDADYGPPIARVYGRAKVTPRITYMASGSGARDVWAPGTILKDGDLGRADIGSPNSYSAPVVMELCQQGAAIVGAFLDKEQSSPETQGTETTSATSYTVAHAADYNRDLGVKDSNGRGLTQVNSAPWVGTYYSPTPGTYQFAVGQGQVRIKYGYVQWHVDQALQAIRRLSGATILNGGHWSFANAGASGSPTWVPSDQCSIQPFPFQVIRGSGLTSYVCGGASSVLLGTTLANETGALYTNNNVPSAWSALNDTNAEGMGFTGTAHLRFERLALTEDMHIPAIAFLVDGIGGRNCSPVTALRDLLVNVIGLPSAGVITDVGPDGQAASSFAQYCANMPQFVINRAIDSREDAFQLLADILDATNSELFYSQGAIKVIPLADTAFGTFTPAGLAGSINLMDEGTADLLTIDITDEKDVYSAFAVNFPDVVKNGEQGQAMGFDDAYANLHGGRRLAPAVDNSWISTSAHAHLIAQLMVRRSTRIRRRFSFTVIAKKWACLEAGDVVSVSDAIRLSNQLCRISLVEEQDDGSFRIEAWEWAQGNCHPVIVTPQVHEGVRPLINVQPATDVAFQNTLTAGCSKDAGTTAVAAQGTANTANQTASKAQQAASDAAKAAADAAATASGAQQTASAASTAAQQALSQLPGKAATDFSNVGDGTVGARLLAANCVTAKNVVISDWENLCTNPSGLNGLDGWSGLAGYDPNGLGTNLSALYQTTTMATFGPMIQVEPGDQFWLEADVYPDQGAIAPNGSFKIGLAYTATPDHNWLDGRVISQQGTPSGGMQHISGAVTLDDANTRYACIMTWSDSNNGHAWWFRRLQVRRMNKGNLIVDGAITSNKVTADQAFFEAVVANRLQASTYTEDANGYATEGWKLDRSGLVLKVPAKRVQLGTLSIEKQLTALQLCDVSRRAGSTTSAGYWVAIDDQGGNWLTLGASGSNAVYLLNGTPAADSNYPPQVAADALWYPRGGCFVIANPGSGLQTLTPDGSLKRPSGLAGQCIAAKPNNNPLVVGGSALNTTNLYYSTDGSSWYTNASPLAATWQHAAYIKNVGFMVVGNYSNNDLIAVVSTTGGSAWSRCYLPGTGGGVVQNPRTASGGNNPAKGVVCGQVNGKVIIATQSYVWTAAVGSDLTQAASWTLSNAPWAANGLPPRQARQTDSMLTVSFAGSAFVYVTLNGTDWRTILPGGGVGMSSFVLGMAASQSNYRAQMAMLVGGYGGGANVVTSGIVNEMYD